MSPANDEWKFGAEEGNQPHHRSLDVFTPFGMIATSAVAILATQMKLRFRWRSYSRPGCETKF